QIEAAGAQLSGDAKGLGEQNADYFPRHVALLWAAGRQGIEAGAALARGGFDNAPLGVQSSTPGALMQMAARQAKGEGALAQVVRQRQDLERQWHILDARLNDAVGKADVAFASELRRDLGDLASKFAAIDARLAREFPDYATLVSP